MPSQPPQPPQISQPTLVLGFVDPASGEIVSTAKIALLQENSLLRIVAMDDIPKGSAACMPLGQGSIAQVQSVAQQVTSTYSSFDH